MLDSLFKQHQRDNKFLFETDTEAENAAMNILVNVNQYSTHLLKYNISLPADATTLEKQEALTKLYNRHGNQYKIFSQKQKIDINQRVKNTIQLLHSK
jgi:hypothetical protein